MHVHTHIHIYIFFLLNIYLIKTFLHRSSENCLFIYLFVSFVCLLATEESQQMSEPPQTPSCQCNESCSSSAVTDTTEPCQSVASAEIELQSQVGKSVTPCSWNMGQKF